jgi:MFS transporter, SET family, sugar efflux transporter
MQLIYLITDRHLRIPYIGLALSSAVMAAAMPYQSVIAIEKLHLTSSEFSGVVICSAAVSLLISFVIAILSDRMDRFLLIVLTGLIGSIGFASIYALQSKQIFIAATIFLIPPSAALAQQVFALLRDHSTFHVPERHDEINAFARFVFTAAWMLTPALVAFVLNAGEELFGVYLISCVFALACSLLFLFSYTQSRSRKNNRTTPPLRAHCLIAFHKLSSAKTTAKILFNCLLRAVVSLQQMLIGLFLLNELHTSPANVGVVAGITAAAELPFIFLWAYLLRYISKARAICCGAAIYSAYLIGLTLCSNIFEVFALSVLGALGLACLLSVTISYLQDLLREMPGLGTWLNSIASLVGTSVAALLFAIGVEKIGYIGLTIFAGIICITAGFGILIADSEKGAPPHSL